MRNSNNSLETISAAATAIINAEGRVQQPTVRNRRWGGCWSVYWCFGFQRHGKRIGHSVLVPEPTVPRITSTTENSTHTNLIALPFVAPPSSPASFLQSEPPSATQSPPGLLSLTSLSVNAYSPGGPNSIFAIGPYAHETQLVSPPVFSTFTTEPSTAPFTPPEPLHLTTPSSPEVPFARLLISSLDHNYKTRDTYQKFPLSHYEFPTHQLYPGSPVGHLISPSSAIGSGTSSPFPDHDFTSSGQSTLEFCTGEPPKLLPTSWDNSLLKNSQNEEIVIDHHRVSFELTAEDIARCMEKKPMASAHMANERDGIPSEADNACGSHLHITSNEAPDKALENGEERVGKLHHEKNPSLSIGSPKEFKFDNDKVVGKETLPINNWAFFPRMEPGIS